MIYNKKHTVYHVNTYTSYGCTIMYQHTCGTSMSSDIELSQRRHNHQNISKSLFRLVGRWEGKLTLQCHRNVTVSRIQGCKHQKLRKLEQRQIQNMWYCTSTCKLYNVRINTETRILSMEPILRCK